MCLHLSWCHKYCGAKLWGMTGHFCTCHAPLYQAKPNTKGPGIPGPFCFVIRLFLTAYYLASSSFLRFLTIASISSTPAKPATLIAAPMPHLSRFVLSSVFGT